MYIPFSQETARVLRDTVKEISMPLIYYPENVFQIFDDSQDQTNNEVTNAVTTYLGFDYENGVEKEDKGEVPRYVGVLDKIFGIKDPSLHVTELGSYFSRHDTEANEDGEHAYGNNYSIFLAVERDGIGTETFFLEQDLYWVDKIDIGSGDAKAFFETNGANLESDSANEGQLNAVLGSYRPDFEGGDERDNIWQQRLRAFKNILRPTFEPDITQ